MLEKAAIQSFRIQVRSELNEYLKDTSQRKIKEKQELAARIRQRDAEDQRWKAMIEDEKSRQEIAAKRRAEERTEREARWAKLKAKWAAIGKPEK
ncbi:hypothetical protein [Ruegeria sp. SCP11]|uniref:hypothetical protein n=1 Tax=Ruegeria sp. SCP11 TaxID=3141378 RepID=UPI0033368D38